MQKKIGALLAYINVFVQNGVYLLYTPLLLRFLGESAYGLFQLTSQAVNTLTILSMGFASAYVRFYWLQKNKSNYDVNLLNGVYILFFGVISIVTLCIGALMSNNAESLFSSSFTSDDIMIAKKLILVMTVNVAIGFISSVFNSYIIANEKFIFQQIRVLLATLLQPILAFILLNLKFGILSIALIQLFLTIVLLVMSIHYAIWRIEMRFSFGKKQFVLAKGIFSFASFILINQIVDLVNNNVPGMIVGKYLTATDVAIYAVVIQIRSLFFQLSLAMSNIFVPQVNKMVLNRDEDELTSLMASVGRIQLSILLFVLGGFIVLGQSFITMWAGSGFNISYWMIIVMVIPVLVPLSQNIGIEIQRAMNLHKVRSFSLGILAVMNILITVLCVRYFGVFGSVMGYIFSIVVGNGIIMNVYNHKVVRLNMKVYWCRVIPLVLVPVIPVLAGVVASRIFDTGKILSFVGVGILYSAIFGVLWVKKAANEQEREMISRFISKMKFRKRLIG
ncbi:lipopolysaccharide biosynthesis protein [Weissella sp. MSCH1]|uniref:lipopolysaccharide biosynthesis protein n=1 Tax=Weissella sp. MSCH1 TaxID=3383343 RepID=UPI003896A458